MSNFTTYYHTNQLVRTKEMFFSYTASEIEAILSGYVQVDDKRAYNGRYFIKNNKKWIHNLNALRSKLNDIYARYIDDEELVHSFGYDVENYYFRHRENKISNNISIQSLIKKLSIN